LKKTLYVHRKLINGDEFIDWAKSQGFTKTLEPNDLHATIAFSKKELDWNNLTPEHFLNKVRIKGGKRSVVPLGNEGAIVLKFESPMLTREWNYYISNGASWDWESYQPHVSITYKDPDVDLSKVTPYKGELLFGPHVMKELDLNWKEKVMK
jgi:hypothetical protein